jgi:hypothetical protein
LFQPGYKTLGQQSPSLILTPLPFRICQLSTIKVKVLRAAHLPLRTGAVEA